MKIAILNDETSKSWLGGAALVNEKIRTELMNKGHQCDIILYNKERLLPDINKLLETYDKFIFANIGYYPRKYLEQIMDSKPFISFRHDIPIILYTQPPSERYTDFYQLWGQIFRKAETCVFISPMQYEVFKKTFREINNPLITPPPLDIGNFEDTNIKGRSGCLYLGDISSARGCAETLDMMKQFEPNSKYTFVGKILDDRLVDHLTKNGATVRDAISHDKVSMIMNRHKHFFYYPQIYDSFCLKILEASICGMNIMCDKLRIGIFSYDKSNDELIQLVKEDSLKALINVIENGS